MYRCYHIGSYGPSSLWCYPFKYLVLKCYGKQWVVGSCLNSSFKILASLFTNESPWWIACYDPTYKTSGIYQCLWLGKNNDHVWWCQVKQCCDVLISFIKWFCSLYSEVVCSSVHRPLFTMVVSWSSQNHVLCQIMRDICHVVLRVSVYMYESSFSNK